MTSSKNQAPMTFDEAHRRIKKGDIAALRRGLDAGLTVNLSNRFSWTLLMLAAAVGNVSIGSLLISMGADIERVNDFGETALSLAAHQGHSNFVELLLSSGASTQCRPHGHSLEEWITNASGLPEEKIASMLDMIKRSRLH
jgi:uncharacterized protein